MKLSFQFVISLLIILSLCSSICCAFASRFSLFNKKMSEQLVCCCVASCYSDVLLLLFQLVALGLYAHTHASNGSYPSTYSIPSIFCHAYHIHFPICIRSFAGSPNRIHFRISIYTKWHKCNYARYRSTNYVGS